MLASGVLFFVATMLFSAPFLLAPAYAAGETPTADAGLGLIAYVGDTVVLDGSASADPEGDPLAFAWTQVGGPPVDLERADSDQPRFAVTAGGTLRFALVVQDDASASAADTVAVVIPYEAIEGVGSGCAVVPAPLAGSGRAGSGLAGLGLALAAGLRRRLR